jgi:hypothetical protein
LEKPEFLQRELAFLFLGDDQFKEFRRIFALRDGGVRYAAKAVSHNIINGVLTTLRPFNRRDFSARRCGNLKNSTALGAGTLVLYHKHAGRASGRTKIF